MKLTTLFGVVSAVLCGFLLTPTLLYASNSQPVLDANAGVAITQFNKAIADYLALRNRLRSEVKGPVKNSTSTQVTDASDALAGGIQRARSKAQPGAIFSPAVSTVIKKQIADAIRTEKLAPVLADIDDEKSVALKPTVHLRLPVSAQMATMPASLLKVLPTLPKELEYRIIGHYLVIRDVDASLILDYIPNAVAR
jgi:hypothetical protein